jgi:hypothetical protein
VAIPAGGENALLDRNRHREAVPERLKEDAAGD